MLTDLLARLDSSVRIAALEAHRRMLTNLAKQPPPDFGGSIPPDALLPRTVLEPDTVELEVPVRASDDQISLRASRRRGRAGLLRIRWQQVEAPEATALVRTNAELILSKRIENG